MKGKPGGRRNGPPWQGPRPRPIRLARASPTTSPSASTSSRARRRTSPATSSTTSTRRPSRPPRSWPAAPAPPPRRSCASRRPSASRATPSCSRRRSRSTGTRSPRARRNGNGGSGAAALFTFDHSEFEASLGADYSNIEETARNLTREQIEASVSALATAQRVADRRRRPDGLLRQLPAPPARPARHPRRDRRQHRARTTSRSSRGSTRTPCWSSLSAGRAHPLLLRALKLARHRRARTLVDHRRDALRRRRALRADPLLLLEQPLLHPLQRGADGPRPGARARRLRPRRGGPPRPHPRLQAEVSARAA